MNNASQRLDPLRDHGWVVIHNIDRDGHGNVDHFISGAAAAYVIETKSGRARIADRGQAVNNAIWAKEKFGLRWVTAVLCPLHAPCESQVVPHGKARVWIVSFDQLRTWILEQRQ